MKKIFNNGDKTFTVEEWDGGQPVSRAEYQCVFRVADGNTAAGRIVLASADYRTELSFYTGELEIDGTPVTDAPDAFDRLKEFVSSGFNGAGGAAITTFEPNSLYETGDAVIYDGAIYTAKADFTAGDSFDAEDWNKVSISSDELSDDLDEKLDKTDIPEIIYGTDDEGNQTAYDKSGFEFTDNKTDEIRNTGSADDTHYPTELAVRKELDTVDENIESISELIGDLNGITNSTDKTTVVAALNSLFKMVKDTDGISIEIKSGGLYITRKSGDTATEERFAELSDLQPLITEIEGLHGKTARLNGYDFGIGITSDNIGDTDIQTMLTAYALVQLGLSDVSEIPNFIGVHNLFDGDGGNHLLVFNQAIVGSGTPENPEFPAHWIDNGLDSVSVASITSLGVVKGSNEDMKVAVETDGTMSVNGLDTALSDKEDSANKTDTIRVAGEADDVRYPTEKAVRTGLDAAGKVDTVNGIEADADKDVKTDYIYETEAEFEAEKDNIPVGATVIKLYEYPDNLAGFMVVPDYAHTETTNRITAWGGTWVADRTGFVNCLFSGSSSYVGVRINDNWAYRAAVGTVFAKTVIVPVKAGDVVGIDGGPIPVQSNPECYFIPPLFIKKELPVVVVEKNGSYSLDEVKTADTWIDGKPVYKRTYSVNNPTNWNEGLVDSGILAPSDIETIIDTVYMCKSTTTSHYNTNIPFPVREWRIGVMPNGNFGGWLVSGYDGMAANTGVMTVWYTKTTD
jgi:hypothetical protein